MDNRPGESYTLVPEHISKSVARLVGAFVALGISAIIVQLHTGSLSHNISFSFTDRPYSVDNWSVEAQVDTVAYTSPDLHNNSPRQASPGTIQEQSVSDNIPQNDMPWEYMLWTSEEFASWEDSLDADQLYDYIRVRIVQHLWEQGYNNFRRKPWGSVNSRSIQLSTGYYENGDPMGYELRISQDPWVDDIDIWLASWYAQMRQENHRDARLTPQERQERDAVYAFTSTRQLQLMGYEVVSHRSRIAEDEAYRRHNIQQALDTLGHVRVINSWTLSFMDAIDFDRQQRTRYRYGNGIVNGEIVALYGWGICGASTAIYQGMVTNTALDIQARNHSKRYTDLYSASINGNIITTPGIDATVYSTTIDVKLTNTAPYPVILVSNFDGEYGSKEEVFTLSQPQDRGSLRFIRSYTNTSGSHRCYVRSINDTPRHVCYHTVQ